MTDFRLTVAERNILSRAKRNGLAGRQPTADRERIQSLKIRGLLHYDHERHVYALTVAGERAVEGPHE